MMVLTDKPEVDRIDAAMMVLTNKPEVDRTDAALLAEELTEIYSTPTPKECPEPKSKQLVFD